MAEKPQESFLAQLSEVEVTPVNVAVQPEPLVEVLHAVDPRVEAKSDIINFGENPNNDNVKSEQQFHIQEGTQYRQTRPTTASHPFVTATTPVGTSSHSANGESTTQSDSPPKTPSATPQTVTGNVKIQLMEISVDEFKANVEYIQQQFPSLSRRLVCDTFSKANFDSRLAIELLAKEQEKKDQTIVPPMVMAAAAAAAAAASKQQQQQLAQQAAVTSPTQQQQQQKLQQPTVQATLPQTPPQPQEGSVPQTVEVNASPKATPSRPVLPRSRRSQSGKSTDESPGYVRVTSVNAEAERALRQKLKSNVRSRVFNHGVKIAHGRETAANLFEQSQQQESVASPSATDIDMDAEGSLDASTAAKSEQPEEDSAAPMEAEATEAPDEPQSAMRILRDSFPSLDEARIAESLDACNQDVDAAIRQLSGRPLIRTTSDGSAGSGGGGGAKFFKSKQQATKVQQARKDYVRAELNTRAWVDPRGAAAGGVARGGKQQAPGVSTLRVFTVPTKRKIKEINVLDSVAMSDPNQ